MTAKAMTGTGRRHRVVAIGSGFGRLTATKALKHAETDITDAVTFLTRIAARGTAHVHPTALWLPVIPMVLAVLTTAGVLITLYVAVIRERKTEIGTAASNFGKGWR
jgi:NADH dehydrogenase FAD-containing subunit